VNNKYLETRTKFLRGNLKQYKTLMLSRILKAAQYFAVYRPIIVKNKLSAPRPPLFNGVFFEVRTRCNGTCPFCAASVGNEKREDSSMPFSLYEKVINELAELNFSGRIAYHINNDPLIFRPLPDFIAYARQALPGAWIQVLTNGKALTLKIADNILKSGLNELSINVYNDDLSAPLPKIISDISEEVVPKYYVSSLVKKGFGPDTAQSGIFRFNVFRRRLTEELETRGGSSPNKLIKAQGPRGFCEYPFTQLNISTKGIVSKCCSDFYFSDPMGNVYSQSLLDIWYGNKFTSVRQHLLSGNRSRLSQCRDCDFYGCFGGDRYLQTPLERFVYQITK